MMPYVPRGSRCLLAIALVASCLQERVDAAGIATVADGVLRATLLQPGNSVRRPRRPNAEEIQRAAAEAQGTADAAAVRAFWQRYERVETELAARKVRRPEVTTADGRVAALIDKAHLGYFATEDGPTRYLALHLQLGNDTPQTVRIARAQIRAVIDGQNTATQEIGPRLIHHGFPYGGDYYPLEACQPAKELVAPPRGMTGTWLVYSNLPAVQTLPACDVIVQTTSRSLEISVSAVQRALLEISVERMGPQQSLALVTLGGMLNTFNVYLLVDEIDALTADKTQRVVLNWKTDAPQPESQLLHWLQNSALGVTEGRSASETLPVFPPGVRELHLVETKSGMFLAPEYTLQPQGPPKVHRTAGDAVAAAFRRLYATLPREQLLHEVRRGHKLSQSAALVAGAARLDAADLPLVLERSQSSHPAVRRAALLALGEFDHPAAWERLETALRHGDDADVTSAAVALAESRYQAMRDRFAAVVSQGDDAFQSRMAVVLARRPRSEWSDLLVRHARDQQGQLQIDILRALVQLNDPRLVDLLAPVLQSRDAALQDLAFQLLSSRTDERSERLASEFVLERLPTNYPDAATLAFLSRTKDPRALPALVRHLDANREKSALISLLGQIGDSAVGDALLARFDKLPTHEQVAALNALRQLRHSRFVALAGRLLGSPQDVIASHAMQGLAQIGGPVAERLLCDALQTATRPNLLDNLALTIANLGTPEARQALQQARLSPHAARRNAGLRGWLELRRNSPGWAACEQGQTHAQAERWNDALEAYTLAAQLDPLLPEAFTGQGDVHLKRSQFELAEKAFDLAYRLDSSSGLACCGLAIAKAMLGRLQEGLDLVEQARPQFPDDVNFSYNAACFYGRAVEMTAKRDASAERDALLAKYRTQALADLAQSVKLGFRDDDWMQQDPDLASLRELPEFQQIVRDAAAAPGER